MHKNWRCSANDRMECEAVTESQQLRQQAERCVAAEPAVWLRGLVPLRWKHRDRLPETRFPFPDACECDLSSGVDVCPKCSVELVLNVVNNADADGDSIKVTSRDLNVSAAARPLFPRRAARAAVRPPHPPLSLPSTPPPCPPPSLFLQFALEHVAEI